MSTRAFLVLICCAAATAAAQPPQQSADRWYAGVTIGVPSFDARFVPEAYIVGANFTYVEIGRPAIDFAIGTLPRAIQDGFAPVGARVGLAIPGIVRPGLVFLPTGGASFLAELSQGGYAYGAFVGGTVLANVTPSAALRASVTVHAMHDLDTGLWLLEIGVVHVSMP